MPQVRIRGRARWPEGRAAALLVAENSNAHYRHAARAARKPGGRAALAMVFNQDCAGGHGLTEKEVQEHAKTAIKPVIHTCRHAPAGPCTTHASSFHWIRPVPVLACAPALQAACKLSRGLFQRATL